jgi:DOMON domain
LFTGLLLLAALFCGASCASASPGDEQWAHSAWLDDRYLVRWTPGADDITFEVSVATLGYVGFGLSHDGLMQGSDVVIGWVQNSRTIFQDRHVSRGHVEPIVDASQDWELLKGSENDTHTVLKFRRAYDTCDRDQDIRITVSGHSFFACFFFAVISRHQADVYYAGCITHCGDALCLRGRERG